MNDFSTVDFRQFKLPLITIYDKPRDFPNCFVARIFDLQTPTQHHIVNKSLAGIRKKIPKGMVRFDRHKDDDACIVEVWI